MKRAYADIAEGQIHYRTEGDGDPILLLHTAVGSSDQFSRMIRLLSKNHRAIAPDYLGHGESDPAPCEYTYGDHARSVLGFMDALGIEKACVVGHHAGSGVGVELAVAWPERVDKLVLSSLGLWETTAGVAVVDPPNFTSRVELQPDGSHLLEWWRRADLWGNRPPEMVEERVTEYVKAGPRGEEIHWAGRAYDARPSLPRIKCPTLVIAAVDDPFYFVAEEVHSLIPGSALLSIEKGAIDLERAMPKEFAEAVLGFLGAPGF